jgi:predicted O-methyltransferase YrrM
MSGYEFTSDWFSQNAKTWAYLFSDRPRPEKVLEIGSYEGRSTVWMMENLMQRGTIVAVDAWEEGLDTDHSDLAGIEARFDRNIAEAAAIFPGVSIDKRKGRSSIVLASLLANGGEAAFDLVYVDGGHVAPTVLSDLVMAFHLCKPNGLIFCDDYLWGQHKGLTESPKLAIDCFASCFHDKIRVIHAWLYQLYFQKIAT